MGTFEKNFPNASFDIVAFVETHHKDESDFPDLIQEYRVTHDCFHTSATAEDKYAGIIFLIRKTFIVQNPTILIPGRLMNFSVGLQHDNKAYNISVFYGQNKINQTLVSQNISLLQSKHSIEHENIILGDFNFCEQILDRQTILHPYDNLLAHIGKDFVQIWILLTHIESSILNVTSTLLYPHVERVGSIDFM